MIDPVLQGSRHSLSKEVIVELAVGRATILSLEVLLCIGPCGRLPPVVLEGGENGSIVSEESWGPNAVLFKGLEVMIVVPLPPVLGEDGGTLGQFVVN